MKKEKRPKDTKERLLRAALRQFARHGYSGCSVDSIVAKAGVNKRMVYHYFGSKRKLYQEVWEAAFDDLVVKEQEWLGEGDDLWELSERMIEGNFRYLIQNPEFSRLLLWENLHAGENLRGFGISEQRVPHIDRFEQALRKAEEGHPWLHIWSGAEWIVHLLGLCQIYFSNQHTLSFSFGLDYRNSKKLEQAKTQTLKLLYRLKA